MAAAEIGAVTRQQLVADRIVVEKHRRIQMIEPGEPDHRDADRKDDWRPASPLLSGHLECRRDAGAHSLLLHHAAALAQAVQAAISDSLSVTPSAFALRAACEPVFTPASGTTSGCASNHASATAAASTAWASAIVRSEAISGCAAATLAGENQSASARGPRGSVSGEYLPVRSPCSSGL